MIVIRSTENGNLREALNEFDEFFLGYEPSAQGLLYGVHPVVLFLKSKWQLVAVTKEPKKLIQRKD